MRILRVVLMLSFVVMTHEFGHYLAMKANGVRVVELAVGLGPTLYSHTLSDGTEFKVKLLPLGGYTKSEDGAMGSLSLASREQVVFAGMLANLLVAMPFLILLCAFGKELYFTKGRLQWLSRWLRPLVLGIGMPLVLWMAVPFIIIGQLVKNPKAFLASASGPVGIVREGKEETSTIGRAASFWVVLNVSLAGFNLMPLLPFDGGQAVLPFVTMLGETATVVYVVGSLVLSAVFLLTLIINDFRKKPAAPF